MDRVKLYNEVKNKLEKLAKLQGIDINKYYIPPTYNPIIFRKNLEENDVYITKNNDSKHDIPLLFYLFCGHLSDRQFMSNSIKFYKQGDYDTQKVLSKVFMNYNPANVAKFDNINDIKKEIVDISPNKIQNTERWDEYLKGIHQCAKWMITNKLPNERLAFSELYSIFWDKTDTSDISKTLYKLRPIWYDYNHLTGVGAAVCYNWLKECGAVWLSKPDLHIKRVIAGLLKKTMELKDYTEIENSEYDMTEKSEKIIDKYLMLHPEERNFPEGINKNCKMTRDEFIAVYMWKWAKEVKESQKYGDSSCTAYKLDRIIYLYCTNGHFYLDNNSNISESNLLGMINQN